MTTLSDAIAKGYQEVSGWTVKALYKESDDTACAIGLAAIGVTNKALVASRPSVAHHYVSAYLGCAANHVIGINNSSVSYEEMMLRLKEAGLAELEVPDGT